MAKKRKSVNGDLSMSNWAEPKEMQPQQRVRTRSTNAPASAFWEKYKHPLWQKKRLEIMERAEFACEKCGDTTTTLNVHHSYYEKDKDPWDYPSESLHCWCEKCHEDHHALKTAILAQLSELPSYSLRRVLGYIKGVQMDDIPVCTANVNHGGIAEGIANAFGLSGISVESFVFSDKAAIHNASPWGHVNGFEMLMLAGPYGSRFRHSDTVPEYEKASGEEIVSQQIAIATHWEHVDPWNCAATG